MSSGSPRDTVLRGIIAIATMSFLLGIFSMVGVLRLAQNDPYYMFAFGLLPLLVVCGHPACAAHVEGGDLKRSAIEHSSTPPRAPPVAQRKFASALRAALMVVTAGGGREVPQVDPQDRLGFLR